MFRSDGDPSDWLPELWLIVRAMAKALDGRAPSGALLSELQPLYEGCIPDHRVEIEWVPEGYSDDPLELPEYVISLTGKRFKAGWLLLERDLFRVLNGERLN